MTGFNRKKKELESQQIDLEIKLEKLKLQAKSDDATQFVNIVNKEMVGVQRKLTNVKMRLRSMQIKRGGIYSERLSNSLPVSESSPRQKHNLSLQLQDWADSDSDNKTMQAITEIRPEITHEATAEIDEADEDFDPTESILQHQRPVSTLLPNKPLPHSELQNRFFWTTPVARWRCPLDANSLLEGKRDLDNHTFISRTLP